MTDTKDMHRSCLTIGDIKWAQAHIDAQDAKINALADFIEDLLGGEDTDGDWRVEARAALAAAKEAT